MGMVKFRAPPLPNPPAGYDSQYFRALLKALEVYFARFDAGADNQADTYTAKAYRYEGITTAERLTLTPPAGTVVFDSDLKKLCLYTGTGWQTITSA